MSNFQFTTALWLYSSQSPSSWYFVTVPKEYTEEIRARTSGYNKGFGSVRVTATTGNTTWQTSIFPDSKSGCYLLPVKKQIRAKESLIESMEYTFSINLIT